MAGENVKPTMVPVQVPRRSRRSIRIHNYLRCTPLCTPLFFAFIICILIVFGLEHSSSCHAYPLSTNTNGQKSSPRISPTHIFASSSGPVPASEGPRHIAFICDGNSRWAKARNLPSIAGHAAGANRLIDTVKALKCKGVAYCTMYAFSTENWRRPASEVRDILSVVEETTRQFYDWALREDISVRVLGDLNDERIPSGLREIFERLERESGGTGTPAGKGNKLTLSIAINYGGRKDILNASKRMSLALAEDDSLDIDAITEEKFESFLGTANLPSPDLLIRTSEARLSNFMLWDLAYTELYFVDTLWPDFDEASLDDALDWYKQRFRRFGARQTTEQGSRM
jgi:undecaprenyl diphosphate synthase